MSAQTLTFPWKWQNIWSHINRPLLSLCTHTALVHADYSASSVPRQPSRTRTERETWARSRTLKTSVWASYCEDDGNVRKISMIIRKIKACNRNVSIKMSPYIYINVTLSLLFIDLILGRPPPAPPKKQTNPKTPKRPLTSWTFRDGVTFYAHLDIKGTLTWASCDWLINTKRNVVKWKLQNGSWMCRRVSGWAQQQGKQSWTNANNKEWNVEQSRRELKRRRRGAAEEQGEWDAAGWWSGGRQCEKPSPFYKSEFNPVFLCTAVTSLRLTPFLHLLYFSYPKHPDSTALKHTECKISQQLKCIIQAMVAATGQTGFSLTR